MPRSAIHECIHNNFPNKWLCPLYSGSIQSVLRGSSIRRFCTPPSSIVGILLQSRWVECPIIHNSPCAWCFRKKCKENNRKVVFQKTPQRHRACISLTTLTIFGRSFQISVLQLYRWGCSQFTCLCGQAAAAMTLFMYSVKGPVTRMIDPLFLSLCLVLPLSKFRAAKTASLYELSEARYSPRKFMQNTHLMLVSDLCVFELFS